MKTVKQLQLSGLLVLLTLLSACQSKPKDGQTDTYTSGVIAIAADESFQPIVQEEIDVFEGLFPLAGIVPRYVTEVDAVNILVGHFYTFVIDRIQHIYIRNTFSLRVCDMPLHADPLGGYIHTDEHHRHEKYTC